MDKYERVKDIKNELKKNIKRLDTLLPSCSKTEDFRYAVEVIRMYFYTRDKIMDLLPKVNKI